MTRLPQIVVTARLTLRLWLPDDVAALSAAIAAGSDHLRPWMSWMAHEPMADRDRERLIRSWSNDWEADGDAVYGAFHHGIVVGGCGLHRRTWTTGVGGRR